MDPIEFPQLRKPGIYRIRAEYSSRGISSVPGWNGGWLKQEDVDKLPLKALERNDKFKFRKHSGHRSDEEDYGEIIHN